MANGGYDLGFSEASSIATAFETPFENNASLVFGGSVGGASLNSDASATPTATATVALPGSASAGDGGATPGGLSLTTVAIIVSTLATLAYVILKK
jgi:hypothetical protein